MGGCFYTPSVRPRTLHAVLSLIALATSTATTGAQSPPVNGMLPSDVRWDAIQHATVVTSPGVEIEDATILMRDGWIEAVGPTGQIVIPTGATIHDGRGKRVMAGFIEPALLLNSAAHAHRASTEAGAHWNAYVTPQVSADDLASISSAVRGELRQLGFAVAATYPDAGIFRGRGSVQLLGDPPHGVQKLPGSAGQFVAFGRRARDFQRNDDDEDGARVVAYPNSIMGAVALLRQTLHDATWRADSIAVWNVHPVGNDPPRAAPALDALTAALTGRERVLFDASSPLDALRSGALAKEFGLNASILGSGKEFQHLSEIAALRLPIIVPLDYPTTANLSTARLAESASLRQLMSWAAAPSNLSRLIAAGASASLTTARLDQRSDFPSRVREALDAGLTESQLLASLTTTPAALLGMSETLGTIAVGRMANLTISEGPLFAKDSRITVVWIAGRAYDTATAGETPFESEFQVSGRFSIARADQHSCVMVIAPKKSTVEFVLTNADGSTKSVSAESVALEKLRGGFLVDGGALGLVGPIRCTMRIDLGALRIEALSPDGSTSQFVATAAPADEPKKVADATKGRPKITLTQPVGDFGLAAVPAQEHVLFRDATLWTSSPDGIRPHTDVLVKDGLIVQIGKALAAPVGGRVVECAGRHITPGLIDCHSHTGIDGDVNEWTQACTAEVRVNDVIDPDDVGWYRELAGGLTCANQLHGSANPIGGQNSVVKLKWGSPVAEWPVAGALPGIKFALGENVVRPKGRYPQTRMGVEAYMRDRFRAAREYAAAHRAYATLAAAARVGAQPSEAAPRVDLELQTLAEILDGTRIIHCHSYRQDEILMLIHLADEFGFRIGTFQHILEGYKVADAIARHGAGGSCFSDWWAYKMEVMDAIPWAGAMMQGQGVLMSFNSDSSELARHLNTESAKAVKYGNLSPARALEFVTINPARQLGIGNRTGSIEVGKDADLVLWSGDPLSPLSLCEQTWIEGTKRFDRADDLAARPGRELLRQQLIVAALQVGKPVDGAAPLKDEKPATPPPTRLRERMLSTREDAYLDLWRRGLDLRTLSRAGVCGCEEVAR